VAFLIDVLHKIAGDLEQEQEEFGRSERKLFEKRVNSLTRDLPPLPDFSHFHESFSPGTSTATKEGDLRKAFFLAYEEENCEYVEIEDEKLEQSITDGREIVSAGFVIPYPPGFPILVPGQVISTDILTFMKKLDVKEIHGYQPELGLQVFTEDALRYASSQS
jgi:arginine decarboxylase